MNKKKSDDKSQILIHDQKFLSENSPILRKYGVGGHFCQISFTNCNFNNVSLPGSSFSLCSFKNCVFDTFFTKKSTFLGCCFKDCKINDSDMRRGDFYDTTYENCDFICVDLSASDIYNCTFKGTRFLKSNLQLIAVDNVKVWKSNEWIKIEDYSSFEKNLDATDMVTTTYVDFDFIVKGPPPLKYVYVKIPVGSEALRSQNQTISLEDMAYNLGKKIVFQKHRFVGLENGPESSENVGHLIDLRYVPIHEKSIVRENILQGTRDRDSYEGDTFYK